MSATVAAIGEALWDIFPDGRHFGGAPGNVCVNLTYFGLKPYLISSFGNDELGQEAMEYLSQRGVDLTHLQTHPGRETGQVTVTLDSDAVPTFHFIENPAWADIAPTPLQLDLASRCDAIVFGTLGQSTPSSRSTTHRFLNASPPQCIRLFDLNLRGSFWSQDLIFESLKQATVLKCNEDELAILTELSGFNGPSEDHLCTLLEIHKLDLIAYTKGADGSIIATRHGQDHQQASLIQATDTTGAGDSFIAALLNGMLAGHSLRQIHRHASQVAAYVCSHQGATPALPKTLITSDAPVL